MKISVSLPDEDVIYVDEYAQREGAPSRSSVLHHAIELLRMTELQQAYASAWEEWNDSEDAQLWERTSADGIASAAR